MRTTGAPRGQWAPRVPRADQLATAGPLSRRPARLLEARSADACLPEACFAEARLAEARLLKARLAEARLADARLAEARLNAFESERKAMAHIHIHTYITRDW